MWSFNIQNVAGIRSGSTTIDTGLNVVQASNFQGKSSLIKAIQTATGATGHYGNHPLTEGADSGSVTLETKDATHEVVLKRNANGSHSRTGNPYLSDETDQKAARLFAFLGENNPIRTAVRNGDDITEYLQEPLNIEEIDAQIKQLQNEREDIERKLERSKKAAKQLPGVQETVTQLENEIAELRERKNKMENTEKEKKDADNLSDELSDRKSSLKDVIRQIERLEEMIERKETQISQKKDELASIEIPAEADTVDLQTKKEQVAAFDAEIELFEDLYRANRNLLDSNNIDSISNVERTLSGDEIECWVCGETSSKETMEDRIEQISEKVDELREQKQELSDEIETQQRRNQELQQKQRKRNQLEADLKSLQNGIDEHTSQLDTLRDKKMELQTQVEELETKLADVEDDYNEELTDLKTDIRVKKQTLENKRERLSDLEAEKSDIQTLRNRKQELNEEVKSLKNQKTETQYNLRDEFDTAIDDIIERFAPGFEGARLDVKTTENDEIEEFDLIIAREGRETSVYALSEGEIELIGVAVALAAYRVYDINERVPCILIDGISQLDSEHLRGLIRYLEDTADILVTTAYPEAGKFDGRTITSDSWELVSDREPAAA